jgi:hypothetical protein
MCFNAIHKYLFVMPAVLLLLAACGMAPSSNPTDVTLETQIHRAGPPESLPWVAYQDGDGPWQTLSGQDGRYVFPVRDPAGRYTLATACTNPAMQNTRIQLIHATAAELPNPTLSCSFPKTASETRTVSGTITDFGGTRFTSIHITGTGSLDGPEPANPAYSVSAPPGRQRLVALGYRRDSNTWAGRAVFKALDVSGNLKLDLSFADPATQTQPRTITVEGVGNDALIQDVRFFHPANVFNPELGIGTRGSAAYQYGGIPQAQQLPEDSHLAYAEAYVPGEGRGRNTTAVFKQPRDLTLTLPPHLGVVQAGREMNRSRFTWEPYTANWYTVELIGVNSRWLALITSGWLKASEYHTPDLLSVPTWNPAWNLPADAQIRVRLEAVRANRPVNEAVRLSSLGFPGHLSDGLIWQTAVWETILNL